MAATDSTCWTIIQGAAAGSPGDRDAFARRYVPVVRAYLAARWRNSLYEQELDDAVQEVFVECFRHGGVLEKAAPEHSGGFHAFLYGVVRNVALRTEARQAREQAAQPPEGWDVDQLAADESSLSKVFDRAWATTLVRLAAQIQAERAQDAGPDAVRRVELLRLRFHEQMPIRDIARRWQVEPAQVHHDYAKARQEFKAALFHVLAFHHPDSSPAELERRCADLLVLLA